LETRHFERPGGRTVPLELSTTWVLALRLAMLAVALLSVSLSPVLGWGSNRSIILVTGAIAALFALTAASAAWLQWRGASRAFLRGHFTTDAVVTVAILYLTGGPVSPFLFLFIPLVMLCAIFLDRHSAFLLSAICVTLYIGLCAGLSSEMIATADGSVTVPFPRGGITLQALGLASALFLVSVATSYLAARLHSSYALVNDSQRALLEVSNQSEELLQGYPEAVIVTELDRAVRSMNEAARSLLEIESGVNLIQLPDALKSVPIATDLNPPTGDSAGDGREISLVRESDGQTMRLHAVCRKIPLGKNSTPALVYFLHDVTRLRTAEEQLALQESIARLTATTPISSPLLPNSITDSFVGQSPVMRKVFDLIGRVADADATVLITGESGTGKELVARAIHVSSRRSPRPFVAVNCGAIPENLIESELFGHKRGAFTGADSDTIGLIRQANGGTLFLDEIGELPLLMQSKLLRSLQEKRVRPVGSSIDIEVDVRIVAATNRNLRKLVADNAFREDLFYRLNVISIQLPALRERREDIPLLVNAILRRIVRSEPLPTVTPSAMRSLMGYHYPGNVRELENIIERAMVLGGDVVLPEHLPEYVREQKSSRPMTRISELPETISLPADLESILAQLEQQYLQAALIESKGVKKQAAQLLGINFRSFRYRLAKYGLGGEDDPTAVHAERLQSEM
jgi:two-component system, NtrC family, response regulator PilR